MKTYTWLRADQSIIIGIQSSKSGRNNSSGRKQWLTGPWLRGSLSHQSFQVRSVGIDRSASILYEVIKLYTTSFGRYFITRIIKSIESTTMGRGVLVKWGPRLIDIDFLGNEIIHSRKLITPHPRIKERRFTLLPMTVSQLEASCFVNRHKMLDECSDPLKVTAILRMKSIPYQYICIEGQYRGR